MKLTILVKRSVYHIFELFLNSLLSQGRSQTLAISYPRLPIELTAANRPKPFIVAVVVVVGGMGL